MNTKHYLTAATQAFTASLLVLAVIAAGFFIAEPKVGYGQVVGNPFTITQQITDEISFLVQAANVTMAGNLQGLTGGTANGSTTAVVRTNSPTGYRMSIAFFNNSTPNAMVGNASTSNSESIRDYQPAAGGEPTFAFSTASTSAVFAYTTTAANTSDLDPSFLNNGTSLCNVGSARASFNECWMEPRTTSFDIINRNLSATGGATSTIHFRVHVPNSPTPALVAGFYTATATLTAINQ
jgi:hypothetical protein